MERRSIKEWNAYWNSKRPADEFMRGLQESGKQEEEAQILKEYQEFPENSGELLLRYCHFYYSCGEYRACKKWLSFYIETFCELTTDGREGPEQKQSAYWGVICSAILSLPEFQSQTSAISPTTTASTSRQGGTEEGGDSQTSVGTTSSDDGGLTNGTGVESNVNIKRSTPDSPPPSEVAPVLPTAPDDSYIIAQYILSVDQSLDLSSLSSLRREKFLLDRSWLLHWAVWPLLRYFFPRLLCSSLSRTSQPNQSSNSRPPPPTSGIPQHSQWTELLDWLYSDRNLALVCSVCPHLLRYLSVMAVLNRHRQDHFKAIIEVVGKYAKKCEDPFSGLLNSLFVKYDFDEAQTKLRLCSAAADADFFLAPLKASIEEHSRLLIFETYCRIQKSINIDMIALKLHMTPKTAEKWIVNLIRQARLEAKIDSEGNRVEIATQTPNIYQQVLERTRNITVRTNVLLQNLENPHSTQTTTHQQFRGTKGGMGGRDNN